MHFSLPLPAVARSRGGNRGRTTLQSSKAENSASQTRLSHPATGFADGGPPEDEVTIDEIRDAVRMHTRFSLPVLDPGLVVEDLPTFDDLAEYAVDKEQQFRLWELEVKRLFDAVQPGTPFQAFKGTEALDVDSRRSYEILSDLADGLVVALAVLEHDGQNFLVEHKKGLFQQRLFQRSRQTLERFCDAEADPPHSDSNQPKASEEDRFRFVDHCTAVIARVLLAAAEGRHWQIFILTTLVKISTKLKVVLAKPAHCAQVSFDNNTAGIYNEKLSIPDHGHRERQQQAFNATGSQRDALMNPLLQSILAARGGQLDKSDYEGRKEVLKTFYFIQCTKYRLVILQMFEYLMVPLRGRYRLVKSSLTSFEICAMVYETGFEQFRTMVFQDNDMDLSGSSDPGMINFAYGAFEVLKEAIGASRGLAAPPPNAGSNQTPSDPPEKDATRESAGTRLSWSIRMDERGSQTVQELNLPSMSQVITVLIPLLMARPQSIGQISSFVNMVIFADLDGNRQDNPVKPKTHDAYTAFVCLTTKGFVQNQQKAFADHEHTTSLSHALMRRTNVLAGDRIGVVRRTSSFANAGQIAEAEDEATIQSRVRAHQEELKRVSAQMSDWVFEETGIMVNTKLYVTSVMAAATLLVCGGISVGASIGERITGVDPFNIATFCWVLAAFVILFCKTVRVHDWPWNDFFHRRVLCKSVTELSSVTGVKPDLILAKLLHDESRTLLETRGPYNCVFNRKSESQDGFSINVPISTWTMLLSGLIMVEVEGEQGGGLVCLDLRRGTKLLSVENLGSHDSKEGKKFIFCDRLPGQYEKTASGGGPDRMQLKRGQEMVWMRTVGLYENANAEFV